MLPGWAYPLLSEGLSVDSSAFRQDVFPPHNPDIARPRSSTTEPDEELQIARHCQCVSAPWWIASIIKFAMTGARVQTTDRMPGVLQISCSAGIACSNALVQVSTLQTLVQAVGCVCEGSCQAIHATSPDCGWMLAFLNYFAGSATCAHR